jgi:hypothetical protein
MKINISEIQNITTILLTKLSVSKGNEIELENDFYWDISTTEIFNPYAPPKDISLGQLSDDIDAIKSGLKEDSVIPYDIKRLGYILIALSAENSTAF